MNSHFFPNLNPKCNFFFFSSYQVWEEGFHPKLIQSDNMLKEKIEYIHYSPVKRGYIEEAVHWRYSSTKDYAGIDGILKVERVW